MKMLLSLRSCGHSGQSCPHGDGFLAHLETVAFFPPFCDLLELEMWGTAVELRFSSLEGLQSREGERWW